MTGWHYATGTGPHDQWPYDTPADESQCRDCGYWVGWVSGCDGFLRWVECAVLAQPDGTNAWLCDECALLTPGVVDLTPPPMHVRLADT